MLITAETGTNTMAGLVKRGGVWYARIWHHGRERLRSLHTRNRETAEKEVKVLEAGVKGTASTRTQFDAVFTRAFVEASAGEPELVAEDLVRSLSTLLLQIPSGRRDALRARLAREILSSQDRKIATREGWQSWLNHPNRRTQPKARTMKGYDAIWRRFAKWSAGRGRSWLHEVTAADAEAYGADLWSSRVSPATFNAHIKFLRSVFGTLELAAGLSENPWRHLQTKALVRTEGRRDLTVEELATILGRAEGSMRLLLATGIFTALRLGDVADLAWRDIDLDKGVISIVPMKTSRTGKRIEIPILPPLMRLLQTARESSRSDHVFPEEKVLNKGGELSKRLQGFFESCGIQTTETPSHIHRRRAIVRVGYHSLRHSFVTLCARAGAPQAIVQQLVGHASPLMTARYTHLDTNDAKHAISGLVAAVGLPETEPVTR